MRFENDDGGSWRTFLCYLVLSLPSPGYRGVRSVSRNALEFVGTSALSAVDGVFYNPASHLVLRLLGFEYVA